MMINGGFALISSLWECVFILLFLIKMRLFNFCRTFVLVSMVKVLLPASIDEDLIKDQELIPSWRKGFFNHLRVAASENYFFVLENITFTFTFVGSR